MESEIINEEFEKLLLIGEDSNVSSLKPELLMRVVSSLAADMQHLRIANAIRGLNLLVKVSTESPEKLRPTFEELYRVISYSIVSGDKLCGFGLALVQSLLLSTTGLAMISDKKDDLLVKLAQSVALPSLTDCHIKAIECIWQIRKKSLPLISEEILEVVNMLYTYMISESGENKFKLLNFLLEIIHVAKNIVTGETISESWITFLLNTVEEDDGIGNVRSLRILLTLTAKEKYILKRPNSARNMLFLLKQSLERFKYKLETSKSSKRGQCLGDLYSLSASHLPIIFDYATQDDIQLHTLILSFLQVGNVNDTIKAAGILWNTAEDGDETVVQRLLDADAHIIAFDTLKKFSQETDKKKEIFSSLLNMLVHMSRYATAKKEILKLDNVVEYMVVIIEKGYGIYGSNVSRALILLVFLLGSEEAESILHSGKYMITAEHIARLVNILQITLRGEHGEDFRVGHFCIPLLVHACLALSQSDSNKLFLLQARAVTPLTKVLHMFQEDMQNVPLCGGGGDDIQSCTLAVETLMHLSFHFQYSNDDLYDAFVVKEDNALLVEVLHQLQTNDKLMMDTRSKAAVLSHRLQLGVQGVVQRPTTSSPNVVSMVHADIDTYSLRLLATTEDDAASISSASLAHGPRTSPIRDLNRSLSQSLGTPSPRTSSYTNTNQVSMNHPFVNAASSSSGKLLASSNEAGVPAIVDGWNISGEMISPPDLPRKQHIMLSYCWHPAAKPHLVVQLQNELKHMGYDVWRDETGSLLVPPLAGCTMIEERLADAIEASDAMLIFVSPMYKLSSNCRMEAAYASVVARRQQRLKIIYVMMDEDYTTVSKPAFCDGWLAAMIGSSVWFSLFSEDAVTDTAVSLASHFADTAHVVLREQLLSHYPATPASTTVGLMDHATSITTTTATTTNSDSDNNDDNDNDDHMSVLTEFTSGEHHHQHQQNHYHHHHHHHQHPLPQASQGTTRLSLPTTPGAAAMTSSGGTGSRIKSAFKRTSSAVVTPPPPSPAAAATARSVSSKLATPTMASIQARRVTATHTTTTTTTPTHPSTATGKPTHYSSSSNGLDVTGTNSNNTNSSKIPRGKVGFAVLPSAAATVSSFRHPSSATATATAAAAPPPSIMKTSSVSTSSTAETAPPILKPSPSTPEESAWEILNSSLMVKDEDGLQAYLLDEGVLQPMDLRYCDEAMVQTIAGFLKTIPKRKFLEATKNVQFLCQG